MRRIFQGAIFVAASAALAACGGGGSSGPGILPSPSASNTPSTTTTASGKLVDRDTNAPLAGVKVALAAWTAGATPTPEGTTAADGSFTFTEPNGKYLLVIGSDSATDTTRPTIHDAITLTGGNQTLRAPTLPSVPTITPPASETSGNYRLATIDQTNELPCFQAFNTQRTSHGLAQVVVDEWLTENSREVNQYRTGPNFVLGTQVPFLTTGDVIGSGGANCAGLIATSFSGNTYATDARTMWFGGTWYTYQNGNQAAGFAEFPIDPRAFTDPNYPNWP